MRTIGVAVLAVLTVLGVMTLADLTQNRPDAVVEDSSTTVEFDVATRRYSGSDVMAARACGPCASPPCRARRPR